MTISQAKATVSPEQLLLLDAHVHLHHCFDVEQVLSKALENFSERAAQLGHTNAFSSFLCLTEMSGENWFLQQRDALRNSSEGLPIGKNWSLKLTDESISLVATHMTGAKLCLFAGRQIVTHERLEVLALLTDQLFEDGQPLAETIDKITDAHGLPVLPWGFGKWIGRRGKRVADFLQMNDVPKVFLGDNSGRPLGWRRPPYFLMAENKGAAILPGTDPLPMPGEERRVGSFGLQLLGGVNWETPGVSILEKLQGSHVSAIAYGQLENPWCFLKNQVALRSQKAG